MNSSIKKKYIVWIVILAFLVPTTAVYAFSWGGRFSAVIPCVDGGIWTSVSAPRGGIFIWTPFTQTYAYGPPAHAGQYGMGLAGPPFICLVSIYPILPLPGIMMLMLGTSR